MVRRSASRRMAPVLNRTRPGSRRADLNRGKPTRRPRRVPSLPAFQFPARAPGQPARTSRPPSSCPPTMAPPHPWPGSTPTATSQIPTHRLVAPDQRLRASRSFFTWAKPQLNALRRAPKCDRTSAQRPDQRAIRPRTSPPSPSSPAAPLTGWPRHRITLGVPVIQVEQHRHRLHRGPVDLEIGADVHQPRQPHRAVPTRRPGSCAPPVTAATRAACLTVRIPTIMRARPVHAWPP